VTREVHRAGVWVGMVAFGFNAAFVIVQTLQLLKLLTYPYDEILIYGTSLGIVFPFMLEMLALHYVAPVEKRFWSHAAVLLTVVYAVFVTANYVVQLATVIPMTLEGASDQIHVLAQTPHSMFWNYDAIGYIAMGAAMLLAAPVFERHGLQKWVRLAFLANAAVTPLIAFVYFYPNFSETILLLAIPWVFTAPAAMLLLALMFKQSMSGSVETRPG